MLSDSIINKTVVLISHFNNPEGLNETISSIGNNENVDLYILDDGSKNKPVLENLQQHFFAKGKIILHLLDQNVGLTKALNIGLKEIQKLNTYQFIARLDVGDTVHPERFAIQEKFLIENPNTYLVGSNITFISSRRKKFLYNLHLPEHHKQIKRTAHYNVPFIHPSVVFRIETLDSIGFYDESIAVGQDYDYFFSILKKHETYNIQQFLVTCELNQKGISLSKRRKQIIQRFKIQLKHFNFSIYAFYGILRTTALYLTPKNIVIAIKKKFKHIRT